MPVVFAIEDISFTIKNKRSLKKWIANTIQNGGYFIGNIQYVFCSDNYLLEINQKHLKHNTYTDIITFNYSVDLMVSTDIFISVDRVKENAIIFKVSIEEELRRVMIHGILHLIGFNDKSAKEKLIMAKEEGKALALYSGISC